ncbi:uncharacterized protein LOC121994483 [Zingiber officinale]|uniref:TmcB/TmcC TPR repeats domain-containing protein n=1 Tax=Zingiber officinale TaxID=94328 RepID=A0A8J5GBX4_ZINOF|nr:uncharacterized protein LOC121994483 [Zingiber officinale]KAG6501869.1 hypothetical protein ZIOFF_041753 [Zingiber officinale]
MRPAILVRSGSFLASPRKDGSHDSGFDSFLRQSTSSLLSPRYRPTAALHFQAEGARKGPLLRRCRSEADIVGSNRPHRAGFRAPIRVQVAEEDELGVSVPMRRQASLVGQEQVEYSGDGTGKGKNVGGSGKGDGESGNGDSNRRISDYYQQMLQIDPSNPLLLRNYGRFLHEVEGDAKAAEGCYGRAILASPGDGEVLSLYGQLVWETHRDEERAKGYFERAVQASPNDCYVLGSYAHFLWNAGEEEDEAGTEESSALVEAL